MRIYLWWFIHYCDGNFIISVRNLFLWKKLYSCPREIYSCDRKFFQFYSRLVFSEKILCQILPKCLLGWSILSQPVPLNIIAVLRQHTWCTQGLHIWPLHGQLFCFDIKVIFSCNLAAEEDIWHESALWKNHSRHYPMAKTSWSKWRQCTH